MKINTKILNLMIYFYTCMSFKTRGETRALIGVCIFMYSSEIRLILKEIRRLNTPNQIKSFHKIFIGNIFFQSAGCSSVNNYCYVIIATAVSLYVCGKLNLEIEKGSLLILDRSISSNLFFLEVQ